MAIVGRLIRKIQSRIQMSFENENLLLSVKLYFSHRCPVFILTNIEIRKRFISMNLIREITQKWSCDETFRSANLNNIGYRMLLVWTLRKTFVGSSSPIGLTSATKALKSRIESCEKEIMIYYRCEEGWEKKNLIESLINLTI